ncbi:MAG: hypothetical protein IIZ67_06310 [Bacilli bacterium]|nr:hypothetical protein [Bacilli bacterium]
MSEERLQEIKDSIDLQLELSKQLKVDDEMILEEKELYDYVIELKEKIKKKDEGIKAFVEELTEYATKCDKAIEFIEEHTMKNTTFKSLYLDQEEKEILLNILKGDKDE